MYLEKLEIKNHPILGNQCLDFINHKTGRPYGTIAFVGENACGKTTALNLLFDYEKTNYITNKESTHGKPFESIYVKQNSVYTQSQSELIESISGEHINPVSSTNSELVNNPNALYRNCALCNTDQLRKIISIFGDEVITQLGQGNTFLKINCGGEALAKIKGKSDGIDISKFSSGQQELLIKLATLEKTLVRTDCVLLDEPETSLHPRWQRNIVNVIKETLKNEEGCPQLFIATHSEKVLESLIGMKDVLIFRFEKINGILKIESVDHLNMALPKTTFAELDYEVYKIPTYDYHDQLYSYFGELEGTDSTLRIDKIIRKSGAYKNDRKKYFKKWEDRKIIKQKDGSIIEKIFEYATLPSYIRNYFHHPREGLEPTEIELENSILLLQTLIKTKRK